MTVHQGPPTLSTQGHQPATLPRTSLSTRPGPPVAVVSDGSGLPVGVTADRRFIAAGVRGEAELITRLTGLTVTTKAITTDDTAKLLEAVRELPGTVRAIFLTGVEADRALQTQRAVTDRGGPAVLTDQDAAAIAVTASLLTALARANRAPARSRVVITGARTVPLLRPLLIAAGIGEIDSWNASDAAGCGPTRFAYGADAVIDLIGRTPHLPVFGHIQPIVISPDPRSYGHLAVPGLLTAILRHPERTVDLYYRCALALVTATPPHRLLPDGPDPDLVANIASAAGQVLHRHHHHSAATTPGPRRRGGPFIPTSSGAPAPRQGEPQ